MDKETVINLARKAGFDISEKWQQIYCDGYDYTDEMQKFAALVASHERDECARMCDGLASEFATYKDHKYDMKQRGAEECAEAIRERSNGQLEVEPACGRSPRSGG